MKNVRLRIYLLLTRHIVKQMISVYKIQIESFEMFSSLNSLKKHFKSKNKARIVIKS